MRARGPVPAGKYGQRRAARTFNRVADVVSFFDPDTSNEDAFDPPRYCWPPADAV